MIKLSGHQRRRYVVCGFVWQCPPRQQRCRQFLRLSVHQWYSQCVLCEFEWLHLQQQQCLVRFLRYKSSPYTDFDNVAWCVYSNGDVDYGDDVGASCGRKTRSPHTIYSYNVCYVSQNGDVYNYDYDIYDVNSSYRNYSPGTHLDFDICYVYSDGRIAIDYYDGVRASYGKYSLRILLLLLEIAHIMHIILGILKITVLILIPTEIILN